MTREEPMGANPHDPGDGTFSADVLVHVAELPSGTVKIYPCPICGRWQVDHYTTVTDQLPNDDLNVGLEQEVCDHVKACPDMALYVACQEIRQTGG